MPMFGGIPTEVEVTASALPTGAATSAKQDTLAGHVDGIEGLLAGGLPSVLDTDSLKVKEQAPLTGFATAGNQTTAIGTMVDHAVTPIMYNVTMTNLDTEYNQALPATCKKFLIKCRGSYAVKLAFVAAGSGTLYLTIPVGGAYWEDLIEPATMTLYFQCATAGQVVEIVAWS